jgi:hypothetical protein
LVVLSYKCHFRPLFMQLLMESLRNQLSQNNVIVNVA